MTGLLELHGVSKRYGSFTALHEISLTLPEQSSPATAVAGESGSGKTTLARLMLGFETPTTGEVRYLGKNVATMTGRERLEFRRQVQPIFQDPFGVFNPFYRVDHVLLTPLRKFGLARSRREARPLIEEALRRVGLRPQDTLGRFPHELSGGQRQRIMVARAVLLRPRVIIADEPVSMVDASLRATILDEIRELNRDLGIAIVYITHDLTTAFQLCDNIIVLYRGGVAEAGAVERVIGDPRHPYSQLLVSSIPLPDLSRRWGDDELLSDPDQAALASEGCAFAPRCVHAMDRCWQRVPPRFRIDDDRSAACYLYDRSPVFRDAPVDAVFRAPERTPADTREMVVPT